MLLVLLVSVLVHAAPAGPELQVTIGSFNHETLIFSSEGRTREIAIQANGDARSRVTKSFKKTDYDKWIDRLRKVLKKAEGKASIDCQVSVSAVLQDVPKRYCLDEKTDVDQELGELWVKIKGAMK